MSFGLVEIDGKQYTERPNFIPLEIAITANGQISRNFVALPGVAPFWLKGWTRTVIAGNVPVTNRPFRVRLGTSDGGIWFMNAGNGGTTERILDSNIFGSGQLPFALIPHIFYSASASIIIEVEDLSQNQPYNIFIGLIGSYLEPA